jgi:NAD(P)-dependent dehydrogenase (short-subunit alcohol dehydrogenase family)
VLPKYATYITTKGAVEQITLVLAKELGGRGVRVNVISPGPMNTELYGELDKDNWIRWITCIDVCCLSWGRMSRADMQLTSQDRCDYSG